MKKHHAWKVTEPDVWLYGEDIYGVHSIAYDPVPEDRTFYAFALRDAAGKFAAFGDLERHAESRGIPVVPVLFRGVFRSVTDLRGFLAHAPTEPSALGGQREGVVLRIEHAFPPGFPEPSARASTRTMSRPTNTGPGTGSRAGSSNAWRSWTTRETETCHTRPHPSGLDTARGA